MQKSISKYQSENLRTRQSFHLIQQNESKEGLFAGLKQKQTILHRLKKGNLFRMSHHLKPEQNNVVIDPFVNWLKENSQEKVCTQNLEQISRQQDSLANQEFNQKQKKQENHKLPKIKIFPQTQKSSILSIYQNKKSRKALQMADKTFLPCDNKVKRSQKQRNSINNLTKTQDCFSKQEDSFMTRKNRCYRNDLSRTQLFQKDNNLTSDQENLNKIRNNFYLNDHKKLMSTPTFFMKQKPQVEIDYDLMRVEGLSGSSVKSFELNLQKIGKKTTLTCYNQLSQHFSSMKKQIQTLILENYQNNTKKKLDKSQINDEIKQNSSIFQAKRIKTQSCQEENQKNQDNKSYLPQFLMKSLIFPSKTSKSQYFEAKKVQNLRT